MVERMDADRAARLAAAMRSGAVSGGGLEDVAEDWRRARAEEARLHVERDALESEVAQLRATLYASFDLDKVADVKHAAALERVRRLEEALGDLSGSVERRIVAGLHWTQDHACAECVPWGDALIPGFRCGRHAALALLKEPTP